MSPTRADTSSRRHASQLALVFLAMVLLALIGARPALASAWWRVSSRAAPTFLAPGGKATIVAAATNVGDSAVIAASSPVSIKDVLPSGLEATEIKGAPAFELVEEGHRMTCELATLTCVSQPETFVPFQALDVTIEVNVKTDAHSGEENEVSVEGGEQEGGSSAAVAPASAATAITVNGEPTPFGVEDDGYSVSPEEEGGALDRQAGSHPFQLTTTLNLNETTETVGGKLTPASPVLPRDLGFELPPGLIGNPQAVPGCPAVDFLAISSGDTNACKADSAIGVAVVTVDEPAHFHYVTRAVPLWNLEPAKGEPARLGFEVLKVPVILDTSLRSDGDYGVSVSVHEAPESAEILSSEVTIWGAPGAAVHDQSRGWACVLGGVYFNSEAPCEPPSPRSETAFLTLPTACDGPLSSTVEGQSWPVKALGSEAGQVFGLGSANTQTLLSAGLEGCGSLPFTPSIRLASETHDASTPTGLTVDVHIPQQSTLAPSGRGEADLDAATVVLPAGVQLNPSSANGLESCSEAQVGYEGSAGVDPLAPGATQPPRFSASPAVCPEASKVGVVRVHTPLLAHELSGAVYLAAQEANPFGSLLALYIVVEDPVSGVRVKLAGEVSLNPETGQISSTFADTPQLPFEDFELEFFGGPRASVSTPALCGGYSTGASFTPWSGGEPVSYLTEPSEFAITANSGGGECASPQLFAPSFVAGASDPQGGAFTPFTLQIQRPDSSQALAAITMRLPPGDAAMLSSTAPCQEPQAAQGECGPESLIGEASASSGFGPDPVTVTGKVYITGPYQGAPFGLAIVTPAVAGPFNLGLVVVRSTINVDPNTAAVTIGSAVPQVIQGIGKASSGIPLQLQKITVTINRPGFEFNPTSCTPMHIEGTLTGAQGASEAVSSPFQAANCASLPFHPTLTASVGGHASKADGAGFDVKVTSAGFGQANIAKVDLQLPVQLPSRQSTLNKACPARIFETGYEGCLTPPYEHSLVGSAVVHTPVLKSALTGPAILVSHGGAAFPDLEFVLQAEGITLILDGHTDVKHGVTYSRFESAPDAPFTSFETLLPAGPYSILGAYANATNPTNLCPSKLVMPTTITAQNGTWITQNTQIKTTGCNAVKPFQTHKPTAAQLRAKALASCKHKYKSSPAKRTKCERTTRHRYKTKAAANHG